MIEKWGVPPEKMIDMQAMTGDSTDNVPGIPGIGPKTAAQLLEEFGDLDTLLARADEIKQVKRRETIIANRELALISRQLVTLKTDTPVDVPLEKMELHPQDGPRLIGFLKAMEFTTLTRRVAEKTGRKQAKSSRQTFPSNGAKRPTVPISIRARPALLARSPPPRSRQPPRPPRQRLLPSKPPPMASSPPISLPPALPPSPASPSTRPATSPSAMSRR